MGTRKKKILYFPQNETHVDNMLPVASKLGDDYEHNFIDTRKIYHQKLDFSGCENIVKTFGYIDTESFYKLSSISRIKLILKLTPLLKKMASEYDVFIFGNDGAIQRVLRNQASKLNKKHFLILDGMIGDSEMDIVDILRFSKHKILDITKKIKELVKRKLFVLLRGTTLSPFIPSFAGATKFDATFVIGDFSNEIISRRYSLKNVYSYGIPRFIEYYSNELENKHQITTASKYAYLTSAYKWHGLNDKMQHQINDIQDLLEVLSKKDGECKLYIKIHPREDINDYNTFKTHPLVEIVDSGSLVELFKNVEVVFSAVSTGILEAYKFGLPVYSMLYNFPIWQYKKSFVVQSKMPIINSKKELNELIEIDKYYCEMNFDRLVTPNTIKSDILIASHIKKELS